MLLSRKLLRQILGALWLIDGALQLQPQMFTMNMVNGVMVPTVKSQPGPIAASLNWIIAITTHNLTAVNLTISLVQIVIGILLLAGIWVRGALIASIVWSLIVWYGGEGLSMLLTGQAGALSGAPGAVLLYPLLGLLVYPRRQSVAGQSEDGKEYMLLPRSQFHYYLAGFWFLSALLQLQPYWWTAGQISQTIGGMTGQGGLNAVLIDPILNALAASTAHAELPLNIALIVIFLVLGVGTTLYKDSNIRPWLIASIVVSAIIWLGAQGLGMVLTGMATDFNSGLLIIVMALACWPHAAPAIAQQQEIEQKRPTAQPA